MSLLRPSSRCIADAKLGIGPPITDGFYYDFDVASPFTPDDLREHREGDDQDHQGAAALPPPRGQRREARVELASEPYKLELITDKSSATATTTKPAQRSALVS